VKDFNSVVARGLNAKTLHPKGQTARQVCQHLLQIARENATQEEKRYLSVVEKRIKCGNLAEIVREGVEKKSQRTDFKEAVVSVYSKLVESLMDNQPYF
jgi:hypothetical protein